MDSLTHAAMGAVIGQAGFSNKLGRRALGWGALVATLPDLDVIVRLSSNPFAEVLYHRGVTHSLWFAPLVGPLLGYLLWRHYARRDSLSSWIALCFWALITHPLLDLFTVYGTQLLAPLSNHRFTLSAVPVIDPIYTGILLIGLIFGYIFRKRIWISTSVASLALILTSGYLFYGLAQNDLAYAYAIKQLKDEGHPQADVRAYTTMFQIFLRRIVVHFPEDVWIGYVTTWAPQKIVWHKHIQPPEAIRTAILNHPYGKVYRWFTNDELIFRPHASDSSKWDMLDSRFGYLGPTNLGIWGRTVTFEPQGEPQGKPQAHLTDDFAHFRTPLNVRLSQIVDLWQEAFGKNRP